MTAAAQSLMDWLEDSIARVAAELPGRLGMVVRFLDHDLELRHNADERFVAASIIKLPIMAEVYRQAHSSRFRLDEIITLDVADVTGGAGVVQYLHPGLQLTIADAVELMISISDNTATNMVLQRIGPDTVNDAMPSFGLTATELGGLFGSARPMDQRHRVSSTTPLDMAELLTSIARLRCVSRDASRAMLRHLEHSTHLDVLPRNLPLAPNPGRLGYPVSAVTIAHKSGSLTGIRHDVGIMTIADEAGERSAVISAFLDGLEDHDLWTPENVGERTLARLGYIVFDALTRTTWASAAQ